MPSAGVRGEPGPMRALFVLTPPESKRLIAKAVARLPEVERARQDGEIAIGHGATNVYVVEEIFGECPDRDRYLMYQGLGEEELPAFIRQAG